MAFTRAERAEQFLADTEEKYGTARGILQAAAEASGLKWSFRGLGPETSGTPSSRDVVQATHSAQAQSSQPNGLDLGTLGCSKWRQGVVRADGPALGMGQDGMPELDIQL